MLFVRRVTALLSSLAAIVAVVLGSGRVEPAGAAVSSPVTLSGIDLHDGQVVKSGSTYYLYGTVYGCGFEWGVSGTPWCGFGVSMSASMAGPWSDPQLLFGPNEVDPFTGASWAVECGGTGAGCFNPRMIQRTGWGADDGVWVLWFNSPADYARNKANAYNVMGCNGPAGPCGPSAGAPYGSYHKPSLWVCGGNGDFVITTSPGRFPAIVCTMPDSTLAVEQLTQWGADGTGTGAADLAGLTSVESPGVWRDAASGTWVMTYSDPNCGYCAGTSTGYATAASLYGPWTAPANVGWSAPPWARRSVSPASCGGQPRTVSVLDGQPWQGIDLWHGTANETTAGLHFEPLVYRPATGSTGDGALWRPAVAPFTCV